MIGMPSAPSTAQHVIPVTGHDQIGLAGDRGGEYRIVVWARGQAHLRQRRNHHCDSFQVVEEIVGFLTSDVRLQPIAPERYRNSSIWTGT